MATALQCPACGFKHRLDAVGDTTVFPCSRCDRSLKLPAEFRNGATARPSSAPNSRPSSGSRTPPPGAAARPPAAGSRRRVPGVPRAAGGQARIPLRILAWVVAFVLGALLVRVVASWTGFVDTNTFLDLMLDHSFSTYSRLLVLIPVWALFATLVATVLIEAPDWWARRSLPKTPKSAISRGIPAAAATATTTDGTSQAKGSKRTASPTEGSPQRPASAPRRVPSRPQAAAAARAAVSEQREPDLGEVLPAIDQRPRRIPRRDTGS